MLDKLTILHVEDSILVKDYIKNFLEDKVNNIIFASNGKEGLEIYLKIKPDIVITDINMPIYDGLKMSKEIKRLNKDQHIILVTGYDNDETLKQAINLGINSFILKPIFDENLLEVLNKSAQEIQLKNDLYLNHKKELNKEKVELANELIEHISHHWRQPLNTILMISSSYEIKKKTNYYKNEQEEIDEISKISQEVEKLANVLKKLDNINCDNCSIEKMQNIIKISNPVFSNKKDDK